MEGSIRGLSVAVFGSTDADDIIVSQGNYAGQRVDLHLKSKSMLELATEMDDCPTDSRLVRDKLIKRDIKDKKKAYARRKLLGRYVNRLDRYQGQRRYTEYERKLNRLKQQVMLQNQHLWRGMDDNDDLTYEGEDFSIYLLRDIALEFYDVTEQDNVLSCMQEMEDFDSAANDEEIEQCEKMIKRLEGKSDEKSQSRLADFTEKKRVLTEQNIFSKKFKRSIISAQQTLRKAHEQEISDGYNLIPKVADLTKGTFLIGGKEFSPVDIARFAIDEVLCSNDFLGVFSVIFKLCTNEYLSSDHIGRFQ